MNPTRSPARATRSIHLLYSPTLSCNLSCSYCYLGEQTTTGKLKVDAARAASTLRHALQAFDEAGVLPFNVSLHGGEVTTLPVDVLEELFILIRAHYAGHYDELTALGHRKAYPHIKTNLFHFEPLVDCLTRHRVSISASIDLPLALHAKHRTTRGGTDWLAKTLDNIRLLARYPHAKKISATVSREHLADPQALIDDIWFIHRELGFDMNQFNLMFAFSSELNHAHKGDAVLIPASRAEQVELYDTFHRAFTGTELEEGLRRNWFDEFKPTYCTSAFNCGERFFLLQSDGSVYSCVRGQGLEEFHYGNIFEDSIDDILATGARKVREIHQRFGFDSSCQSCNQLSQCHTGCPVVKLQSGDARSYTCDLQKTIYAANPRTYPPADPTTQAADARSYAFAMHPGLAFDTAAPAAAPAAAPGVQLPGDLLQDRNALEAMIAADPILQVLYSPDAFRLELGEDLIALPSQLLKPHPTAYTLARGEKLVLHVPRSLFAANCEEELRNTLYLQMLRDTPVVYGDEGRAKQEHLFTHQLYANTLMASDRFGPDHLMVDLSNLVDLHSGLYRRGVLNNLFFTTGHLRDYHYQKQRNNAFYHIQAMNLPFQNLEFYYQV